MIKKQCFGFRSRRENIPHKDKKSEEISSFEVLISFED
jgi:hypothetical protein